MAEADWSVLDDSLSIGSVDRGPSAGFAPPPGGGSFVYGFNSLDTSDGAVGLFCSLASFIPMAKGGRITAALQRGLGGGSTGFAPMIFIGLGGDSVNDQGYLLGLQDGDPAHIVLRKGAISAGLPDVAPPGSGVLRRSTETVEIGEWVHLRLDMIVNLNGDVRLQVFRNDLDANALGTAPDWTAIAGMTEFVDDALGINSGSAPFTSGRVGFAFQTTTVTRRGFIDHIEIARQL